MTDSNDKVTDGFSTDNSIAGIQPDKNSSDTFDQNDIIEHTSGISILNYNNTSVSYIPTQQSADSIFHFFGKFDYLQASIEKMSLMPRYYIEDIDYLKIFVNQAAYPMICFCDINLHKLQSHIDYYGGYGIAFSKEWGQIKGIQPIHYLNVCSRSTELSCPCPNAYSCFAYKFSQTFESELSSSSGSVTADYLINEMQNYKPAQGTMERQGESIKKNFTDECEWRYVPDLNKIGCPQILIDKSLKYIAFYNLIIAHHTECHLKFDPKFIKYIIVTRIDEVKELCKLIRGLKSLNSDEQDWLISTIIVWEEDKGDF